MVRGQENATYYLVKNNEQIVAERLAEHASDLPPVHDVLEEASAAADAAAQDEFDLEYGGYSGFNLTSQDELHWLRNCTSVTDEIYFDHPRVIGILVPLGIICLVVIFGNLLVIAAVKMTRKMRGATNLFIVSLAWADLMLGIIVLPTSAMVEVSGGKWIFGSIWCSIWLATDVWACTASILHLVVISLDRYIAVTHPMTYPNIMTSTRSKLLILFAWVLSFAICFPPLVGWNEEGHESMLWGGGFVTTHNDSDDKKIIQEVENRCNPKCELNQEPSYAVYSALGSFFVPMLVMMFFNWRIFRTAAKTTKAIKMGYTKVKGAGGDSGMGIHRGGGGGSSMLNAGSTTSVPNGQRTPRRTSASMRNPHSVVSSRRTSATCLNGNLKRQQTISIAASMEVSTSRTLPRSSSASTTNIHSTKVAGNGCAVNLKSANSLTVTTNVNHHRRRRGSGGLESPLLSAKTSNGMAGGRQRLLSVSTNSLHVPPSDLECKLLGSSSISHSTTLAASSSSSTTHHRSRSSPNSFRARPTLSQHQPCPNHAMGKTFAEMGTQTQKSDRPAAHLNNGKCNKNQYPFKWKFTKTFNNKSEAVSPTSINLAGNDQGSRCTPSSCFHFRRWKHLVSSRHFNNRRHQGSDRSGESDDVVLSAHNSTTTLRPAAVNQENEIKVLPMNGHSNANGPAKPCAKRNIKSHVKRFRMETKAAKTLGIIVGCFICCWFPFFTIYLVTAFCETCVPPMAFAIFFWLGYCNSALNPFIYAMFSRDFRNAFKKILCKFLCNKNQHEGVGALARMGLPFAPQTVAIGMHDRFNMTAVIVPPGSQANADNNSTTSSSRTRKNSLYP